MLQNLNLNLNYFSLVFVFYLPFVLQKFSFSSFQSFFYTFQFSFRVTESECLAFIKFQSQFYFGSLFFFLIKM